MDSIPGYVSIVFILMTFASVAFSMPIVLFSHVTALWKLVAAKTPE